MDCLVPTKASTFLRKGQDCEEVDGEVVPSWVSWGRRAVHKLLSVFKKKKKKKAYQTPKFLFLTELDGVLGQLSRSQVREGTRTPVNQVRKMVPLNACLQV